MNPDIYTYGGAAITNFLVNPFKQFILGPMIDFSKNIEVPCFILNNHIVWGATAMMLGEIRDLLLKI